ncbi:MAG TPA: preprotein translocase subunit SecA, partial [Thiotrichaceae bacterium]|nr:preprotein translocase subunit SecA [Thiotrichaceae bacterium]
VIPTHRPMIRIDSNDLIYMTIAEKFDAIVDNIQEAVANGQPVLVGTASIETSELLSSLLRERKIKHEVLNAKQHEREAHIVENAGRSGAITIATNMAGRGTDIVLGGSLDAEIRALGDADASKIKQLTDDWQIRHDEVVKSGGLHIVGTERHESRRIDNQLRGRSGRQGDPGSSRFFLSLEDNLMRIFASDRVKAIMQKLGMEKGQAIEAGLVSKSIENAQRKVEAHNFDIRKHLLEYDDVANDQRKVIYELRSELLEEDDNQAMIQDIRVDVVNNLISLYVPPNSMDEQWDIPGLTEALTEKFGMTIDVQELLDSNEEWHEDDLREHILEASRLVMQQNEKMIGEKQVRELEGNIMLHFLDMRWKEHLAMMDHLRQSVSLRGYAQKNPKQEYKRESFEMFQGLLDKIKDDVVGFLLQLEIQEPDEIEQLADRPEQEMEFNHVDSGSELELNPQAVDSFTAPEHIGTYERETEKVGRNQPCPCGSGKKYKQCHGRLA